MELVLFNGPARFSKKNRHVSLKLNSKVEGQKDKLSLLLSKPLTWCKVPLILDFGSR